MSCIKLKNDFDNRCSDIVRKYHQEVVIINKSDIDSFYMQTPQFRNFNTNRYLVSFTLKKNSRGYRITNSYHGNSVFGSYEKTTYEDIPNYKHQVQIFSSGISEETKSFLDRLDFGNYIAVIQSADGLIEVYGFEYGLKTEDYEYNISDNGGALISLSSDDDLPEDERPYIYISAMQGNENNDFNNNFENNNTLPMIQSLIVDYEDKFIQDHNNKYLITENY